MIIPMQPEERILEIMHDLDIDVVLTLPCDRIKALLSMTESEFFTIPLTREENGIGICAGAYMAGARPLMMIQSTGLGNMINAIASLNQVYDLPLPIIASWRGVYKLSLIHISEPTRLGMISYAVFCLKKKKHTRNKQ